MSVKKALKWVLFWVGVSLLFNFGVYIFLGQQKALEYFGGYVIEQSLSLDNLFLFLIIFESFGIPARYQRRVLNYGIAGAIILRLIFVLLGVSIVSKFHWVLYIFGVTLIFSGVKMMFKKESIKDFKDNMFIKLLSKVMPISNRLYGEKFFIRVNKKLYATPLIAVLLVIESSDVIFAIDSIPAIFSITTDPFIVYTSNIFAILGLRSMYFLLARLNSRFSYVRYGIALILTFTGVKLSLIFFSIEISIVDSLVIIFAILLISILLSLGFKTKNVIEKK